MGNHMRFALAGGWLICVPLFLYGCSTASPPTMLSVPSSDVMYPRMVSAGDMIQIGFFVNNKSKATLYKIGAGDTLRIEVADHPELTREEVIVLPDGRISLNLIGSIAAVGKTVEEVASEINSLYTARKIKNASTVVAVTKGQQRVRMFLQSLGREQGVNRIELRVYDEKVIDLPFIPQVAVGRPLEEIRRDIREAYERVFGDDLEVTVNITNRIQPNVYVMGEVKKPGSIEVVRSINVMTAIATAGGFADTAKQGEVLVIRFKPDGSYDHWSFDLKEESLLGHYPVEFKLQGNDVVYVSKSTIAKVDLFVEQYIRKLLPVDVGFGAFFPIVN
jgi:polysaccharide biosynthesis/export protein